MRYVLEGSVRRVGETITINAQLISTETGAHVWADRFDGERSKLGELQVEFVSRLANSLGVELVKAEALRAARERPSNPDAADLAMQGWASLNSGFSKVNYDAAIGYFERALQLDPGLTRAQVGLAWGLVDRAFSFRAGNETVDLPRAEALLTVTALAEGAEQRLGALRESGPAGVREETNQRCAVGAGRRDRKRQAIWLGPTTFARRLSFLAAKRRRQFLRLKPRFI